MHHKLRSAAFAFTCAVVACGGEGIGTGDDALSSAHADDATRALFTRYWNGSTHDLNDAYPSDHREAGYWIYAQALDAMLDATQRTGSGEFKAHATTLYATQNARGWTRNWFDDENWMALALIRFYDVTHDPTYLDRAEQLFADIMQNGHTSTGIWWDRAHTQKATASNFGPAITAARLNERTGKASYETDARAIYDYWYSTMVDRTTSQVADHRNADGTVDWRKFTYDTGLAIGASLELYRVTNNAGYLSHAYAFGDYLIHDQVAPSPYGAILHDDKCTGDCAAFKGIAFRFLTKLFETDKHQTQYGDVLHASAQAIWSSARNTQSNTFAIDWGGGARASASLGSDVSAVIALNLAAEFGL